MNRNVLSVFLLISLSAAGCTPHGEPRSGHDARSDHDGDGDHDDHDDLPALPTDAATTAAAQRVTFTPSALECPTEILGLIDVHQKGGSNDAALWALRVRAAQLGAEALTNVEYRHGDDHEKLHISGTAVRCRDILNGRRYDVIELLDISKPMGREEDAFSDLRARARSVGANVILDVHFEHGEDSHLRITGKAVRAYDR
jgi:uncharacterized protein YbjQ (UPF0145 family)